MRRRHLGAGPARHPDRRRPGHPQRARRGDPQPGRGLRLRLPEDHRREWGWPTDGAQQPEGARDLALVPSEPPAGESLLVDDGLEAAFAMDPGTMVVVGGSPAGASEAEILERVSALNPDGRVSVYTASIGEESSGESFLRELAEDNGGRLLNPPD